MTVCVYRRGHWNTNQFSFRTTVSLLMVYRGMRLRCIKQYTTALVVSKAQYARASGVTLSLALLPSCRPIEVVTPEQAKSMLGHWNSSLNSTITIFHWLILRTKSQFKLWLVTQRKAHPWAKETNSFRLLLQRKRFKPFKYRTYPTR